MASKRPKTSTFPLGEEVHLEFRRFQEIVLTEDGTAKKAGVPE